MAFHLDDEENQKEVRKDEVHSDSEQTPHDCIIQASEDPDVRVQIEDWDDHEESDSNIS
jgi:hypothetical protein